jgi:hypothetical protein
MTRATRPARTGTARPSARKARGRPLSYMSQKYASARPVAGKTPCLNPGWMFAMELTPDLGAARCRANGRRYHRAGQHRLPTASTDAFWASSGLISGAGATGNSRATLPVVAMPAGRKVGARSGHWLKRLKYRFERGTTRGSDHIAHPFKDYDEPKHSFSKTPLSVSKAVTGNRSRRRDAPHASLGASPGDCLQKRSCCVQAPIRPIGLGRLPASLRPCCQR